MPWIWSLFFNHALPVHVSLISGANWRFRACRLSNEVTSKLSGALSTPRDYSFLQMQNQIHSQCQEVIISKSRLLYGRILIILLSVKVSLWVQDLNNFSQEMSKLLLLMRPSRHQILYNLGEDFLSHTVLNCKTKGLLSFPMQPWN